MNLTYRDPAPTEPVLPEPQRPWWAVFRGIPPILYPFLGNGRWFRRWHGGRWELRWVDPCRSLLWLYVEPGSRPTPVEGPIQELEVHP